MSAFNLNKPIYSASFIIHFESASRYDDSANSTTKFDHGKSSPSDFIPQKHGMNKGTKNTSYDHLFAGIDPHEQQTLLNILKKVKSLQSNKSSLEDLGKAGAKYSNQASKDLEPHLDDDPVIVVGDSDEDEGSRQRWTSTIVAQSINWNLGMNKDEAEDVEAEAALLKAQPSFPNVELPAEFLSVPTQVEMVQAKLKTLDALPSLLNKFPNALNQFSQAIASKKTKDTSIPSTGQAST
ncbi:hypothetical protein Tco_1014550 [Tanacetum coccineum]